MRTVFKAAWRGILGLALCCTSIAAVGVTASAQVTFVDVTDDAGVSYQQHTQMADPSAVEILFMSGGAAVGDVDNDGWLDLFVTRFDDTDLLFRNRGDGTFEDISEAAGFTVSLQTNGAVFADVDNDNDLDLYVNGLLDVRCYLYINNGAGVFTEEATSRGAAIETTSLHSLFSASAADVDRDGWVDLHTDEWFRGGFPSHSRLLRGVGASMPGHFDDVTLTSGMDFDAFEGLELINAFATRFADLDNDGWPDAAVVADFGTSRLLWNRGDGTFEDGTVAANVGTDENGMGNAIGDIDNDGDLDWFVTSIYDPADTCATQNCNWGPTGNRLYLNNGDRTFTDATDLAGVRDGGWGWAAAFFDYDNDGDLDLAMNNGQFFPNAAVAEPFHNDAVRLWRNDGSASPMVDVAEATNLVHAGSGKGLLVFDYDNDGDLDLFLTTNGGQPRLFRNDGANSNDWLRVALQGVDSTNDAFGARVYATAQGVTQMREISGGSHYLSQSERVAHFGFGQNVEAIDEVRIVWPSGRQEVLQNVPTRQLLRIREPNGDGGTGGQSGLGGQSGSGGQSSLGGQSGSGGQSGLGGQSGGTGGAVGAGGSAGSGTGAAGAGGSAGSGTGAGGIAGDSTVGGAGGFGTGAAAGMRTDDNSGGGCAIGAWSRPRDQATWWISMTLAALVLRRSRAPRR